MNFNFAWKKWYCFRDLFFLGEVGLELHFCYCRMERSGTSDPKEKKEQTTTNTKAKKGPHTKGRKWKDPHKHTKKMPKQSVQQIFSDFSFRFWLKCKNANFALRKNKRQSKAGIRKERRAHRKDMCKLSKIVNLKNIQNVN